MVTPEIMLFQRRLSGKSDAEQPYYQKGILMGFYGRSNRMLIENELRNGGLRDCQIVECDLSSLEVPNAAWEQADLRDLHANDIRFTGTSLGKSNFTRSSFMRAGFYGARLSGMVLDGLTLIKSQWKDCGISESHIRNSCLQRTRFENCRIISSTFSDFEGLNAVMEQCVIAHSMFSISYGSGMNGFSGGSIRNCIFYNCRFEGYPLRGAGLDSSVFLYCSGEIGEDMDCSNVSGLGLRGRANTMTVKARGAAENLLARFR